MERDFDNLEYEEITFFHTQIVNEERTREQQMSRQAAFICYSMGAAGDKSYESYLSSLGLIDDRDRMKPEKKRMIAMQAHENANRVLDTLRGQQGL